MRIFYLTIPNQHGAWSALLSCYLIGLFVNWCFCLKALIVLLLILFAFLTRHTIVLYFRFSKDDTRKSKLLPYLICYIFFSLAGFLFLFIGYSLSYLPAFAAIGFLFFLVSCISGIRKKELTTESEITGMAGLSLIAPLTDYVLNAEITWQSFTLWIICMLFFTSSVFHVRYLTRNKSHIQSGMTTRLRAGFSSLFFHSMSFTGVLLLALYNKNVSFLLPLAFVPVTVKSFYTVLKKYEKLPPVKRIGITELIHAILFILLTVIVFNVRTYTNEGT